jgi:excisionase family DNA binding protein
MYKVLMPSEVADRLHMSSKTVLRWIRSGRLRGTKVGGKLWRVLGPDLVAFLAEERLATRGPIPEGGTPR